MTMLPFSLLDFSGFRFSVINNVSAPKLLSLISVTCPNDTRKVHTFPYNELYHHLWDSLAPSMHTLLCNPVSPGQFCALPSECLALWPTSAAEHVCMPRIICSGHAWWPGQQLSCHCWKPCTVSACFHGITYTPYTFTNWCNTHHTQKSKNTSYFKVCHGSGRSSIFNLTYLCYPLMAVEWHNLHVPITCWNLQSHDTISCQTRCYLIFWNFLVYPSEVRNSKYGSRNTSITGSTTSSSVGATTRFGLWPVEQYLSICPYLSPTLSIFSLPTPEDLFAILLSIFSWVFLFHLVPSSWVKMFFFWASYPPPFPLGDQDE